MCDSGKKANNLDTEIEGLHRELATMKKKKVNISYHRNMDARAMQERIALLVKDRDRLNEEFARAVSEGDGIVRQFNDSKQKLLSSINEASAAVDLRLKEKFRQFDKSLQDYILLNRLYSRHLGSEPGAARNLEVQAVDDSSILLDSSKDILCDQQLMPDSDMEQIANFATEGSFLLDSSAKEALDGVARSDFSPETDPRSRMVRPGQAADPGNRIRS